MEFETAVKFIKDVGFPIAVSVFLLWRFDRRLGELITEIRNFHVQIGAVITKTGDLEKHVSEEADRMIREVDHNIRGAIGHLTVRKP